MMGRKMISKRALHRKRMDEQERTARDRRATEPRVGWIGWRRDEPLVERLGIPMMPDERGYYWLW